MAVSRAPMGSAHRGLPVAPASARQNPPRSAPAARSRSFPIEPPSRSAVPNPLFAGRVSACGLQETTSAPPPSAAAEQRGFAIPEARGVNHEAGRRIAGPPQGGKVKICQCRQECARFRIEAAPKV
jgi:hypothetical protein